MNTPESPKIPKTFNIYQRKSALFRAVPADGVWVSVNPFNLFHLTFYSEMPPIATMLKYKQNDTGGADEDIPARQFENEAVSVREMEVDVVLSLEAARTVHASLEHYLNIVDARIMAAKAQTK